MLDSTHQRQQQLGVLTVLAEVGASASDWLRCLPCTGALCWQHPRIQQPVGLLPSLPGQRHDMQAMHTRYCKNLQEGRWVRRVVKHLLERDTANVPPDIHTP